MKASLTKVLVLPFAALFLVSACNKEGEFGKDDSATTVRFVIGGNSYLTKAADADQQSALCRTIDISEETGIKGLTIEEEVSSLDEFFFNDVETKGTPVFTENIDQIEEYQTIQVSVYDGDTQANVATYDRYKKDGIPFNYEGGKVYFHDYGDALDWSSSDNGTYLFFLKAPVADAGRKNINYDPKDNKITFEYVSPADPKDQKDILFSSRHITKGITCPMYNRVLLYHALTGVKFKIGAADNSHITITSIEKVEISNINSIGHCTVSPSYEEDIDKFNPSNQNAQTEKSADISKWTGLGNPTTFSVTFDSTEQNVDLTTAYSYPTSFTSKNASKGNLNDAQATKTFLLIPQTLGDDVKLTITFTYTQGGQSAKSTATVDFGTKLKANGTNVWKAGEIHTYSLTVGDRLDVTIDDQMTVSGDSHKKNDLVIKNTGTATAYMRVAAFANWFYDRQNEEDSTPMAITPCLQFDEFFKDKINTTDWFYCVADGFYYYKHPVAGNTEIPSSKTLFGEIEFGGTSGIYQYKPYNNCHLEVEFAVQSVRISDVSNAWPAAVATGNFDTTVTQMN